MDTFINSEPLNFVNRKRSFAEMVPQKPIKVECFSPNSGSYQYQFDNNKNSTREYNTTLNNQNYNKDYPEINGTNIKQEMPDTPTSSKHYYHRLSPNSEDEGRTNFILSTGMSEPTPDYPTPTSSPDSNYENLIKNPDTISKMDERSDFNEKKTGDTKKLDDETLKLLNTLKQMIDSESYEVTKYGVDYQPQIKNWLGDGIYSNLPPAVIPAYDMLMRSGFNLKTGMVDLMNRVIPEDYEYNPNRSSSSLNYDLMTIMLVRTMNNVASRRSRYRKKFADQIKINCLKIDMDENVLLRKQEVHLQEMVRDLENKMINVNINFNTMLGLRNLCGLI